MAGHRATRIFAIVAEAAKAEHDARALAAANRTAPPPHVWGTVPPIGERMIKKYLTKARAILEAEGRELPKKGAEVLGLTWWRSNDLYARALREKRYGTCRLILRDQMEMFGLMGAIKFQLAPGSGPGDMDTAHLPELDVTEEQLAAEWHELATRALGRFRAETLGLPPGGPVSVQGSGEPTQ